MKKLSAFLILLIAAILYVWFGFYCYTTHEMGPFFIMYVMPGIIGGIALIMFAISWAVETLNE